MEKEGHKFSSNRYEVANMVMIQDPVSGKVLVQDRVKSWKGISFPGGHVEDNESFYDSAVREVKEETGLCVRNLIGCGVIHWLNRDTLDRYIVFLYRTTEFSGELIEQSAEGRHFWMDLEDAKNAPSTNDFPKYLPMFLGNGFSEAYGFWGNNHAWELEYK